MKLLYAGVNMLQQNYYYFIILVLLYKIYLYKIRALTGQKLCQIISLLTNGDVNGNTRSTTQNSQVTYQCVIFTLIIQNLRKFSQCFLVMRCILILIHFFKRHYYVYIHYKFENQLNFLKNNFFLVCKQNSKMLQKKKIMTTIRGHNINNS